MQTDKACVVCGFRIPKVKRRDARYCKPVCRARAAKARNEGRDLDALRSHHTALRWRLLAYWFVGLRARRGMRPLKDEEVVERLAGILKELDAAKQRAARLKEQLARWESGLHKRSEFHQADWAALRAHLDAAEAEIDRLKQDLEMTCFESNEKEEGAQDDKSAELLEALQLRYMDLAAENERLKEAATAARTDGDLELQPAIERAEALEQEKADWNATKKSLENALAQKREEVAAAKQDAANMRTVTEHFQRKLLAEREDASRSLSKTNPHPTEAAQLSTLREEISEVRQSLASMTQQRNEARAQVDALSARHPRSETRKRGNEGEDRAAEKRKLHAERDAAREEARKAQADLQQGKEQLAARARQIVETLKRNATLQNPLTTAAHS